MVQRIVQSGEKKLREISKPVVKIDKKIKSLISDLKDTLAIQKNPEGVGLAAPQIGKNFQVFLASYKGFVRVVINPQIIEVSDNENKNTKSKVKKSKGEILEGCLSLPHYYGPLKRSDNLTLKYLNEEGNEIVETFKGFEAQIMLHEIDHLNGILFIDRLLEQKKQLYKLDKNEEWEEVDI